MPTQRQHEPVHHPRVRTAVIGYGYAGRSFHSYLIGLVPELELRGIASKGLGGAAMLSLILIVLRLRFSVPLALVASWWAIEELQVVICSILFAVAPWPVPTGQALCSSRIDVDLGSVGICVIGWLSFYLYRVHHGRTSTDTP